jgi:hypothetical protein
MFSLLQMEGTMPFSVHPDMMVGEWLGGPFVYDGTKLGASPTTLGRSFIAEYSAARGARIP